MYTIIILLVGMYLWMVLTKKYYEASKPFTSVSSFWEWIQVKVGIKVSKL